VLATNIVVGDTLNGTGEILLAEYSSPKPLHLTRRWFRLADVGQPRARPVRHDRAVHYLALGQGGE
jgi:hypothetical protein